MHGSDATNGALVARRLARLAQIAAVAIPLLDTLERFRRPFGEKFVFAYRGGSADLWLPYLGARAIIEHVNPYGPLPMYLRDPSGWPSTYPPTMLALYVPLVWATNNDIELASQLFYWLNIVALCALSLITWQLSRLLAEPSSAEQDSFLLVLISLSLNGFTMFALDRGQSEIVSAALCWGGILLFLRGRHGWAMAAVTLAAAIKGYAVPVALGLLIATRGKKQLQRALGASALVGLLLTIPVAPYLKDGFESMLARTEYGWRAVWYNHSFKNAFYQFAPGLGDVGRRAMLIFTLLVMLAALWRFALAAKEQVERATTARSIVFAGAALALMIGLPVYSGPYNFVLVLPALILAATRYRELCSIFALSTRVVLGLGLGLLASLVLSLRLRLLDHPVSLAALGLVTFVACLGALTLARTRSLSADRPDAPRP